MDYAQLVAPSGTPGSIRNWVNNSLVDPVVVLELAQSEIYSRLRVRELRKSASFTVAAGAMRAPTPANYLDPISLKTMWGDVLLIDEDALLEERGIDPSEIADGTPSNYAVFDEAFQFDCMMQQDTAFALLYYGAPDMLSVSNPSNFLTRRYPHLLIPACRFHAETFAKNWEARDRALQDLEKAIALVEQHDDLTYRGMSPPER